MQYGIMLKIVPVEWKRGVDWKRANDILSHRYVVYVLIAAADQNGNSSVKYFEVWILVYNLLFAWMPFLSHIYTH